MKLHLPKALFAAVLVALCGSAYAATYADWTITGNEAGQTVYTTTQNGAYDINLGAAAITTGSTQPYSITVLTTNTAGWTIPTGDLGSGLIVASTSNGSGNSQGANNFTIRFGQTAGGEYQGKAWINNWGAYATHSLTKAVGVETITTLGATLVMDPAMATGNTKLRVSTAEGSQLTSSDLLISDNNLVSAYNYATLSNKGAGLSDYSTVSTTISVAKATNEVSGATVGNLTAQDTSVVLSGVTFNGKLATTGTGSFSLGGNLSVEGLSVFSNENIYGETQASATADGNGFAYGTTVYQIADSGNNISVAEGATFTDGSATGGTFNDGKVTFVNAGSGPYYVNNGTVSYTQDSVISGADAIHVSGGATLSLESALSSGLTGITSDANAKVSVGSGVELASAKLTAQGATKLGGSGIYAVTSASLGTNVSLDTDWTGTVRLTGATGNKSLAWAVANGSTVEMNGATGWANWNGDNAQNIRLTNNGETAAWIAGAYSQNKSNLTTYSGNWSGEGTYVINITDAGKRYMDHKYTGDLSAWTGELKLQAAHAESQSDVTFANNATVVNAKLTQASGVLNVFADANTTFNGDISANNLTVNADKTVVINGSANNFAGVITNNGVLTINNTTVNATMVNTGTLNIGTGMVWGSGDYSHFDVQQEGSTSWSDTERSQGFSVMNGASYFAVKGGTVAGDIAAAGLTEVDGGYVFTMATTMSTDYTISASTATLTSADTEHALTYNIVNNAATVTVESGSFDFSKVVSGTRSHLSSLVLDGGNATISGGNRIFSGDVTINSGSTLTIDSTDSFVYSHAGITEPDHSITVNEGGTLAFGNKRLSMGNEGGGANVYKVIINGGSITGEGEGSNGALDYFSSGTIEATGTTGAISANVRVRGGVTLTVDVKGASDTLTMSGLINSNGTGHLTKDGEGTLVLSHKNTYGGNTTVNAGTLKLATGGQDGAIKGTLNINAGGKVDLAAGDATGWGTSNHVGVLNINGGELHVSVGNGANTNQTFANTTINLTGGSITGVEESNIDLYSGSSTVHAKAADGATAETPTVSTVSGVTLSLREASTTFTVDENAKLVLNTGLMDGNKSESYANALVVEGAGTLEMKAAGSYQGGTTINGGTVVAGNASALGTGAVTVNEGASLVASEGIAMSIGTLTLNAGSTIDFGTAAAVETLNIGGLVTLGSGLSTSLESLTEGSLTLFSGVSSFNVGSSAFVAGTAIDTIFADVDASKYVLNFADNTVSITLAPTGQDIIIDPSTDNQVITGGTYDNIVGQSGHSVKLEGETTITGSIDMAGGATASIATGASVSNKGVTITGTGTESSLSGADTGASFAVNNAAVTVDTVAEGETATLEGALVSSSVTNESGAELVVSGGDSTVTKMDILNGSEINFTNVEEKIEVEQLTLSASAVVGVFDGELRELEKGLTVTETLIVEGDSTMNANLTVAEGVTMFFNGTLTMGSTVNIAEGTDIYLSETLTKQFADGIILIDSIDADSDVSQLVGHKIYGVQFDEHGDVIRDAQDNVTYQYLTTTLAGTNSDGTHFMATPEPATATLSLLALAGLCARRRRH